MILCYIDRFAPIIIKYALNNIKDKFVFNLKIANTSFPYLIYLNTEFYFFLWFCFSYDILVC